MDTSQELSQLARIYRRTAHQILRLRIENRQSLNEEMQKDYTNVERELRDYAARLSLLSAIQLGAELEEELKDLAAFTTKLDERIKQLKSLEKALKIAALLLGLGAGILTINSEEIKTNITGIAEEISG